LKGSKTETSDEFNGEIMLSRVVGVEITTKVFCSFNLLEYSPEATALVMQNYWNKYKHTTAKIILFNC